MSTFGVGLDCVYHEPTLEREHPKLVVADMAKNLRHEKVFIDWSQNADHKTTVGVYSLRAKRDRPFVSMPVKWSELKKSKVDALYFEAGAALRRLKKIGNLFAPVLTLKQKLPLQFQDAGGSIPGSARVSSRSRGSASPKASGKKSGARGRTPRHARARALPGRKALAEYEAKRHFDRTAEPLSALPRRSPQGSRRRFVIQKHAASHLHYDFRLEIHDVLKSWAVPKNLSLKEDETRTAFDGRPPDRLFGVRRNHSGRRIRRRDGDGVDIGTYDVVDGNYWKGSLTVFLSGKKLKGEWTLTRTESDEGKPKWFVHKTRGDAKAIPKKRETVSALTGRTMEQIAGEKSAVWRSDRARRDALPRPTKGTCRSTSLREEAALRQADEGDGGSRTSGAGPLDLRN